MTCPADGLDPDLLRLVRALWTAYDTPCEFPVECAWDDLPDPQRSNWLALARASHDLGVRISGPQVPAAPNPDPVEVGRVGEAPDTREDVDCPAPEACARSCDQHPAALTTAPVIDPATDPVAGLRTRTHTWAPSATRPPASAASRCR